MKIKTLISFAIIYIFSVAMICGVAAQPPARFGLPELPYAMNGLEPHMSRKTLELHYGKHYKGYIDNLNKLIPGTRYEDMPLELIVRYAEEGPLYNNAGQTYNHQLFFLGLSPNPKKTPTGFLAEAIDEGFGSFKEFQTQFADSAAAVFGSGWTWLAAEAMGNVVIRNYPNGGNPARDNLIPLMGIDVWEHSYYLDYQNDRKKYIRHYWEMVDWSVIERRYDMR